ncbi:MAG: hypothetical protein KAW14_10505 [Candidatus Aegiribacteria sp.]|nr:hypothetical protein [Candidatus Aegiribacteria sp.]
MHFLHRRRLLPKLCRYIWLSMVEFVQTTLNREDVIPGGILKLQTFGGLTNRNSYAHALVTDVCWDRQGKAYSMSKIGPEELRGLRSSGMDRPHHNPHSTKGSEAHHLLWSPTRIYYWYSLRSVADDCGYKAYEGRLRNRWS